MRLAALAFAVALPVAAQAPAESLLLVGWDGAERRVVERLLREGRLPHLARLAARGSFSAIDVVTGATETKPGWAEILTGRDADAMGIEDNRHYRPVPEGATVLEAWKKARPGACAALVSGKPANLDARGPHEVCLNCQVRDPGRGHAQTWWWDRERNEGRTAPGVAERWVKREGEPYLHAAKALDAYETRLGSSERVGERGLAALEACGKRPFAVFVHFEEPDETGHTREKAGDYEKALVEADAWLGRLLERLEKDGSSARTAVVVCADHGFDVGALNHRASPRAWAASSRPGWRARGDRKDLGASLFRLLGLPERGLQGVPLQEREKPVSGR